MDYEFKIAWSNLSIYDLDNILKYLTTHWTQREVINFKKKLSARITLIQKSPLLFRKTEVKQGLRKSVLSRQTSIFYTIDFETKVVSIVRLFDNRMNMNKI